MPLRRFFLKTRIFGPRDSPSTTPRTLTSATNGAPARNFAAVLLEHEHAVDADFLTRFGVEVVNGHDGPLADLQLTAAALNDCEHARTLRSPAWMGITCCRQRY